MIAAVGRWAPALRFASQELRGDDEAGEKEKVEKVAVLFCFEHLWGFARSIDFLIFVSENFQGSWRRIDVSRCSSKQSGRRNKKKSILIMFCSPVTRLSFPRWSWQL